jgi:hypothetical protein
MRILRTLVNHNAKIGIKQSRPRAGRDWNALPIFMVLEFGTARAVLLRMPDGPHRRGEGGGAYAYAPARHRAVFLFGRLRRWTRDRGCDLAQLTKFFARVGERGSRADEPHRQPNIGIL